MPIGPQLTEFKWPHGAHCWMYTTVQESLFVGPDPNRNRTHGMLSLTSLRSAMVPKESTVPVRQASSIYLVAKSTSIVGSSK